MKCYNVICQLGKWLSSLLELRTIQKGTIGAYKSYEKKACRDFQRTCHVHLRKEERVPESALLYLHDCKSADDVFVNLANSERPESYITRLARIWEYYELIDIA